MSRPDKETDEKHVSNPEPGDYWDEMLVGICVILDVTGDNVTLCREKKEAGHDKWTWDLDEYETMTKNEFKRWLSYGTIPGYWACVNPRLHMWAVEQWRETKREDYYEEVEYIEKCMSCRNRDSSKCNQCRHN